MSDLDDFLDDMIYQIDQGSKPRQAPDFEKDQTLKELGITNLATQNLVGKISDLDAMEDKFRKTQGLAKHEERNYDQISPSQKAAMELMNQEGTQQLLKLQREGALNLSNIQTGAIDSGTITNLNNLLASLGSKKQINPSMGGLQTTSTPSATSSFSQTNPTPSASSYANTTSTTSGNPFSLDDTLNQMGLMSGKFAEATGNPTTYSKPSTAVDLDNLGLDSMGLTSFSSSSAPATAAPQSAKAAPAVALTGPVPCGGCGSQIPASNALPAGGKYWHRDCLVCSFCMTQLSPEYNFMADNKLFCKRCYDEFGALFNGE